MTIEDWFCCLNPRERAVLRLTIEGVALTLNVGIPREVWELFWATSAPNGQALRDAFLVIYGLEIVTIGEGDEQQEVIRAISSFVALYAAWALYLVSPSAACIAGCQQTRFP